MDQLQKLRQKGNSEDNMNNVGNNNNDTDSFKSIDGDLIREQVKIIFIVTIESTIESGQLLLSFIPTEFIKNSNNSCTNEWFLQWTLILLSTFIMFMSKKCFCPFITSLNIQRKVLMWPYKKFFYHVIR